MKTIGLQKLLQTAGIETLQSNKCHVKLGGEPRVHLTCTATAFVSNLTAFLPSEQERLLEEILKKLPRPGSAFELIDDMPELGGKKGAFVVRLEDDVRLEDGKEVTATINLLISR